MRIFVGHGCADACSEGDAQADLHGWSLHVVILFQSLEN
jgi:hypothetical protein